MIEIVLMSKRKNFCNFKLYIHVLVKAAAFSHSHQLSKKKKHFPSLDHISLFKIIKSFSSLMRAHSNERGAEGEEEIE